MHTLLSATIAGLTLFTIGTVSADPTHSLRIVVPYTPGGQGDGISRSFAAELGKALKTTVITENKPGGGGIIAYQAVKQSAADGLTMLFAANSMITSALSIKDPGYRITDFTPVTTLGDTYYVLVAPKVLRLSNIEQFIDHAKSHPAAMNYATLGPGTTSHLLAERLRRAAGFEWQDISYRGAAPAMQAVMSNDVQGYFTTQGTAQSLRDSEKVTLLATAAGKRSEFVPWLPTFKEMGMDGIAERAWFALFVRSDTPHSILAALRTASKRIMATDAMRDHQRTFGLSPYEGNLDQFMDELQKEEIKRAEELSTLGLRAE